jgi:hypothetical protein
MRTRLPLDDSRCFDTKECEKGNVCLRNDEGRVWSYFRKENICNKENGYKMLILASEENGEVYGKNDKKT